MCKQITANNEAKEQLDRIIKQILTPIDFWKSTERRTSPIVIEGTEYELVLNQTINLENSSICLGVYLKHGNKHETPISMRGDNLASISFYKEAELAEILVAIEQEENYISHYGYALGEQAKDFDLNERLHYSIKSNIVTTQFSLSFLAAVKDISSSMNEIYDSLKEAHTKRKQERSLINKVVHSDQPISKFEADTLLNLI